MSKFLFTMLPANDLGLPTRLVPIARALADRGHDVAVFNPAPVPAKLIEDAGLKNLPMPSRPGSPIRPRSSKLGLGRGADVRRSVRQ
jgi:hypothetical protein